MDETLNPGSAVAGGADNPPNHVELWNHVFSPEYSDGHVGMGLPSPSKRQAYGGHSVSPSSVSPPPGYEPLEIIGFDYQVYYSDGSSKARFSPDRYFKTHGKHRDISAIAAALQQLF